MLVSVSLLGIIIMTNGGKMDDQLFSEDKIQIINYELEIVGQVNKCPTPHIARQLADLGRKAKRLCETSLDFASHMSTTPFFHPGRIFISREVMVYLGKVKVLVFLNCYVRGGWYSIADETYQGGPTFGGKDFGGGLEFCIHTNSAETRTVVRFNHERLEFRRKMELTNKPDPTALLGLGAEKDDGF